MPRALANFGIGTLVRMQLRRLALRAPRAIANSTELHRRAFGLGPAQMLVEPRHDLDEIAGPISIVELVDEAFVPGILAGAGRARQAEKLVRACGAGGGARIVCRGAALVVEFVQGEDSPALLT